MRPDLPAGTVTFLFTDIAGSTKLLYQLGAAGYADALAAHRRILREAFAAHGGVEVDTQGDAFFVAFPTAPGALAAAAEAQAALMEELALHFLADCPLVDGAYAEAEDGYRRALDHAWSAGLMGRATDEVLGVAMSLAGSGDCVRAVRLAACAHEKQADIGKGSDHWWRTMQDRLLGAARAKIPMEQLEQAELEGSSTPFEKIVQELLGPERQ